LSKPTILLADDHPGIFETVAPILEPTFEIIGRADDGQALLEAVAKLNPDVVVTDISMPVLDGIEAANKLKKSGSSCRIVFLTVHDDPDFIEACLATGALGYVSKPRMALDLVPAIREALKGHTFVSPNI
jgi:DNA-binding NarL/FixJ family response regulator